MSIRLWNLHEMISQLNVISTTEIFCIHYAYRFPLFLRTSKNVFSLVLTQQLTQIQSTYLDHKNHAVRFMKYEKCPSYKIKIELLQNVLALFCLVI